MTTISHRMWTQRTKTPAFRRTLLLFIILIHATVLLGCHTAAFVLHQNRHLFKLTSWQQTENLWRPLRFRYWDNDDLDEQSTKTLTQTLTPWKQNFQNLDKDNQKEKTIDTPVKQEPKQTNASSQQKDTRWRRRFWQRGNGNREGHVSKATTKPTLVKNMRRKIIFWQHFGGPEQREKANPNDTHKGSNQKNPDHDSADANQKPSVLDLNFGKVRDSPSPPSFIFSEFLDTEALLRTAKNMGDDTTSAAEHLVKQVSDMMIELQASVDLSSFLHQANEIVLSSTAAGGVNLDKAMNETREHALRLLSIADGLLSKGYVNGDPLAGVERSILRDIHVDSSNDIHGGRTSDANEPQALFESFDSAVELNDWTPHTEDMYKMANMASIIYSSESKSLAELRTLGESLVATGTTSNVKWSITDSLATESEQHPTKRNRPRLIRTVAIRGFDASDENVDRQGLFRTICCSAQAETLQGLQNQQQVLVHGGLYKLAQQLYDEVKDYLVDWLSPDTKIILVGHSIGGSLANLLLFLLTMDQGVGFVKERVRNVYTFGAPPVSAIASEQPRQLRSSTNPMSTILEKDQKEEFEQAYPCDVLQAFGLPSTIVHAYLQPWDPIVRLFSYLDPLYPLIGEIDLEIDDGMVLWPRGPPRALRHITAAIIDAWGEDWYEFRDEFHKNCNQTYSSVGLQHIFLPDPTRYLTDRFISMDIAVPPVQTLLRLSSRDLLPALEKTFPLDTFEISHVPQAIRSFVHHFYPAYSASLEEYVKRLRRTGLAEDVNKAQEQDVGEHLCFLLDIDPEIVAEVMSEMRNNEDIASKTQAASRTSSSSSLNAHSHESSADRHRSKPRPWRRAVKWLRRGRDEI